MPANDGGAEIGVHRVQDRTVRGASRSFAGHPVVQGLAPVTHGGLRAHIGTGRESIQ
ncbi:hypothetical protein D3C72_2479310 [compost metagenome]